MVPELTQGSHVCGMHFITEAAPALPSVLKNVATTLRATFLKGKTSSILISDCSLPPFCFLWWFSLLMDICVKFTQVWPFQYQGPCSLVPQESLLEGRNTGYYYYWVSLVRNKLIKVFKLWGRHSTKAHALSIVIGAKNLLGLFPFGEHSSKRSF